MKYLILFFVLSLVGCNKAITSIENAEETCKTRGGISVYHAYNLLVCKDGALFR